MDEELVYVSGNVSGFCSNIARTKLLLAVDLYKHVSGIVETWCNLARYISV